MYVAGCSCKDVETKEVDEDLEEGELLDDGEVDEKAEESEVAEPLVPTAIPSLLDMKISPPRNGKTFFQSTQHSVKLNAFNRICNGGSKIL